MNRNEGLARWAAQHLADPEQIDCTTTVMLKILDGKCKMNANDKTVIAILYDAVKERPGRLFGAEYHALIAQARLAMDEAMAMFIYEKRLFAETMLSRPVMKRYKAWLREQGILQSPTGTAE